LARKKAGALRAPALTAEIDEFVFCRFVGYDFFKSLLRWAAMRRYAVSRLMAWRSGQRCM